MRDQLPNLDRWADQIGRLVTGRTIFEEVKSTPCLRDEGWEASLSVYENDSIDNTAGNVERVSRYTGIEQRWVTTETLGTQRYGSIWSLDRLRNLANARQRCLDQAGDLSRFDKIAYIEPDVTYDPAWCAELILARHPLAAGLGEPDIYSGWSLRTEAHPKYSMFLYDTCATRQTARCLAWDFERAARVEDGWVNDSLIKTYLGDIDSNCLHRVWSTFNCFCVYNAKPFYVGLGQDRVRWGYVNHRLRTGQEYIDDGDYGSGWLDSDTSVMCESFRARGFNNVLLNTNCIIRHL